MQKERVILADNPPGKNNSNLSANEIESEY